jgi:hypothetical protein
MIINHAQFEEIPMAAGMIAHVNELGSGKPELLTWTNRRGEIIGDGPSWNTMEASTASMTSEVAGATKDDDDKVVVVAEEDRGAMPTTDVNVVNNITGVDDMRMDTQDVYEVWNEEVPEYNVGEVDRINDYVEVATKLASGGVTTTRWDQLLKVIPAGTKANQVSPTGTG